MKYLVDDLEVWKALIASPTSERIWQSQSQTQLVLSDRPRRGRKVVQIPSLNALPSSQQYRLASLRDDSEAYLRESVTNS